MAGIPFATGCPVLLSSQKRSASREKGRQRTHLPASKFVRSSSTPCRGETTRRHTPAGYRRDSREESRCNDPPVIGAFSFHAVEVRKELRRKARLVQRVPDLPEFGIISTSVDPENGCPLSKQVLEPSRTASKSGTISWRRWKIPLHPSP